MPSSIHNIGIHNDGNDEKNNLGIITASAGNHAQGVALASKMNNLPCTIVMPTKAPTSKIAATKSYGAKVILEGEDYDESLLLSKKIAKDKNLYQDISHFLDMDKTVLTITFVLYFF
jgi:threonine dehydratase